MEERVEIDLIGRQCFECGKGEYQKCHDWEGELHFSACNHAVKRWTKVGGFKMK